MFYVKQFLFLKTNRSNDQSLRDLLSCTFKSDLNVFKTHPWGGNGVYFTSNWPGQPYLWKCVSLNGRPALLGGLTQGRNPEERSGEREREERHRPEPSPSQERSFCYKPRLLFIINKFNLIIACSQMLLPAWLSQHVQIILHRRLCDPWHGSKYLVKTQNLYPFLIKAVIHVSGTTNGALPFYWH